jgi:ribosomal protein L40E
MKTLWTCGECGAHNDQPVDACDDCGAESQECPACHAINSLDDTTCIWCGYDWPLPSVDAAFPFQS